MNAEEFKKSDIYNDIKQFTFYPFFENGKLFLNLFMSLLGASIALFVVESEVNILTISLSLSAIVMWALPAVHRLIKAKKIAVYDKKHKVLLTLKPLLEQYSPEHCIQIDWSIFDKIYSGQSLDKVQVGSVYRTLLSAVSHMISKI